VFDERTRTEGDRRPGVRTLDAAAERRAVEAALALVPVRSRYEVVIVDPDLAPDSGAIRRLDAFTVIEPDGRVRPKVYVNRESKILEEAARGADFYVKVLAAVIVHEIAHLDGGSERSRKPPSSASSRTSSGAGWSRSSMACAISRPCAGDRRTSHTAER